MKSFVKVVLGRRNRGGAHLRGRLAPVGPNRGRRCRPGRGQRRRPGLLRQRATSTTARSRGQHMRPRSGDPP